MISAVERGLHLPGLEVLLTLSQTLHVAPSEVLERLELSRVPPIDAAGRNVEELDKLASEHFWSGDYQRAVAVYDLLLRTVHASPPQDPEARIRRIAVTEIRRGAALRRCGATHASRAAVERAITLADDLPAVQAEAYIVLVALLVQLGKLPLARDAAERAVQLAAGCDAKVQGWAWIEKGEVLAASGRFVEARRAFLHARRLVREAGDYWHEINVEGNIGACLHGLRRHTQARTRYLKAVDLARRYEVPNAAAHWLVELSRLHLDQHKTEQSDAYAHAALRIAKPENQLLTIFRAEWLRYLVRQQRHAGNPDRHRVAYLRKLYSRLEEHVGVDEVRQFRERFCTPCADPSTTRPPAPHRRSRGKTS